MRGGLIQAIGKPVTGRLRFTCVAGSAADVHPLLAIAGSIGVDGDQADIAFAQLPAPGVDALGACPKGDIVFIRSDQGEAYCICTLIKKTLTSFIPFHHSFRARGGFSN